MAQMINFGNELIRINTAKNTIEYSLNQGRTWYVRCTSSSYGCFCDLLVYGKELLACTSKGVYYSVNEGRTWFARCASSSYGDFIQLYFDGKNLMATTSKGVYYSTNEGRTWLKR
ncbi:MAG: exo-alpha-sialidase [Paludibacteraceae bacterium]|jgi:hypothetical protein|nr:exo-alpha-sialidase [Paludibacteraceae bacterium]